MPKRRQRRATDPAMREPKFFDLNAGEFTRIPAGTPHAIKRPLKQFAKAADALAKAGDGVAIVAFIAYENDRGRINRIEVVDLATAELAAEFEGVNFDKAAGATWAAADRQTHDA
jgi:hypothetical protein